MWPFRIAAILLCICAFDAAAGSARAPLGILAAAMVPAALATFSLALLWNRPRIATALGLMLLCVAFAAGALLGGTADGPGALALSGLGPGDSAAAMLVLVLAPAAVLGTLLLRNALARVATVAFGAYVLVPTLLSIGHGGLRAALAQGPLAAFKGTYAGILVALPLAAVALALATVWLVRSRGLRAALAGALAVSLFAANQLGSVVAVDARLPGYLAYRSPALIAMSSAPSANSAGAPAVGTVLSPAPASRAAALPEPAGGADPQLAGLGPSEIDAGDRSSELGAAPVAAVQDAISALSAGRESPSAAQAQATALRAIAQSIPEREYSLRALAASLPDDASAVFAFVRDAIDIDPYDGAMRGALGTWLSRAGSPSDKTLLLAWLLTQKHYAVTFVRGTLSDDERRAIANVAPRAARPIPADATAYFDALAKKSATFAAWSQRALATAKIRVGAMPQPFERIGARHYWLQIVRDRKTVDLDPTVASLREGGHLGQQDATFAAVAALPRDEYHHVTFNVVANDTNSNIKRVIMTYATRTADIAYSPVRLGFGPQKDAATFDGALQVGSKMVAEASVKPDEVASVAFEIVRDGPGLAQRIDRRWILAPGGTAQSRADQLQSLVSLVVTPGRGANAFSTREQFLTLAQISDDRTAAANGTPLPPTYFYPVRIADFFVRDDLAAQRAADGTTVALARSRADIAMQQTVRAGSEGMLRVSFDIVDNAMSSLRGEGAEVARINLARGYADTQLERDVSEDPTAYGTIALFNNAGAVATNVVGDAATAQTLRVSPELRDGLDQTFTSGEVALAPAQAVALDGRDAFGWWAVDPVTGNAVGRMTGAKGDTMAEYAGIMKAIALANVGLSLYQAAKQCAGGFKSLGCVPSLCVLAASAALAYAGFSPGNGDVGAHGGLLLLSCQTIDTFVSK